MASSFMPALNRRRGFAYSFVFVLLFSLAVLSCGRSGGRPAASPSPDAAPPASSPVEIARDLGIPDAEDLSRKDAKLASMDYDTRLDRLTDRFFEEIMRIYGTPEKGKVRLPAALARDPYFADSDKFDRSASIAPREGFGIVGDLAAGATAQAGKISLSWTYANKGDYNQDGEVGISDVTPIALNFGALTNDGTNDEAERVVDGSGSGEVGIDDVTPIALNYLAVVQSYTIEFLPPGDTVWQSVPTESRVMFASATLPPSGGFKTFSVTLGDWEGGVLPPVLDGTKFRVAPLDSLGAQGEYSNEAVFNTGTGNVPPVARGSATPEQGTAPLTVTFKADGSYDTDGEIVKWEWDLLGNSSFADYTPSSGVALTEYSTPGRYDAVLRVTDDGGATNQITVSIFITMAQNNPPIITASVTPKIGTAPFTAYFVAGATDTDGTIVSYEWDLGDGVFHDFTSTQGSTSHLYTAENAGDNLAILRVTDNAFASTVKWISIYVISQGGSSDPLPPVASAQAWPEIGDAPFETTLVCNRSYDPDGQIVKYEWDFEGDGIFDWEAPQPQHVLHTYDSGIWNAVLRVTDNDGLFATSTIALISNSTSLNWQKQVVDQLPAGSDFQYQYGIGMATSPTNGELCVTYPVDDSSYNAEYTNNRLRFAWRSPTGSVNMEDFSVPNTNVYGAARPVFAPDGTLYIATSLNPRMSSFYELVFLERSLLGDIDVFHVDGTSTPPKFGKNWFDVNSSGSVGLLYKPNSLEEQYVFYERNGQDETTVNPFGDYPDSGFALFDLRYLEDVPEILTSQSNLYVYSRAGETFSRELLVLDWNGDSLVSAVNGVFGVHLSVKSNQLWRYFKDNGVWQGSPLVFQSYEYADSPPIEMTAQNGNWCYLISANYGVKKPALVYDYGSGYILEPIAENMDNFSYCAISASESQIYVAGYNRDTLTLTLYVRDAPL